MSTRKGDHHSFSWLHGVPLLVTSLETFACFLFSDSVNEVFWQLCGGKKVRFLEAKFLVKECACYVMRMARLLQGRVCPLDLVPILY